MTGINSVMFMPVTFETAVMGGTLLCLLLLSGFVSGSEAAYFSLKPEELDAIGKGQDSKNRCVAKLLIDPERLLATIIVANNLINISIVMLSAAFSAAVVDFGDATILRFITDTIIITAILLLFGEVVPKIFASTHRLSFARFVSLPLSWAHRVLKPFTQLLIVSTNVVNNRLAKHQNTVSPDDLSKALELTSGNMTSEKEMLEGIVKFMDLEVCDIMTPRIDVVSVQYDCNFNKLLEVVVESGYSRLPVIGDKPDDIKGIIYVKDILAYRNENADFDWHKCIRTGIFVPESKEVNDMLTEFQSTKTHMAIIVDEYGCMQGVVTLEDIIEEIVGDISDSDDEEEKEWQILSDGSYLFEAKISLNDFCKVLNINNETFDSVRGEAETLAGLILEKTGIIPRAKTKVEICGYRFEIVKADTRKIETIKLNNPQLDTKTK